MRSAIVAGLLGILPTQAFVAPFGVLNGAIAAEAGLDLLQAMALSGLVFAGASQLSTIELLSAGAPAVVILAAGLAINLRFTMYSAALAPWLRSAPAPWRIGAASVLVDNNFAVAVHWYRAHPSAAPRLRAAYFIAAGLLNWLVWITATWAGFALGATLPPEWKLEFAAPIAFLAMALPLLRGRPAWTAAAVATVGAALLKDLPYGIGLLIASALGIGAALLVDGARPGADEPAPDPEMTHG
ncbi:MAG: AzlC family ABC transporter permease [Pseudomonadota bacterium]